MAGTIYQLKINRAQLEQLCAHLFTFLYCQALQILARTDQALIETAKELGCRLWDLCRQGRTTGVLHLSAQEVSALAHLCHLLHQVYDQGPPSKDRTLALEHLSSCCTLIQSVTTQSGTPKREDSEKHG